MSANRRVMFSISLSCGSRQQDAQQVLSRLAAKGGESVPARLELPPQMCGILRRIFHAAAA